VLFDAARRLRKQIGLCVAQRESGAPSGALRQRVCGYAVALSSKLLHSFSGLILPLNQRRGDVMREGCHRVCFLPLVRRNINSRFGIQRGDSDRLVPRSRLHAAPGTQRRCQLSRTAVRATLPALRLRNPATADAVAQGERSRSFPRAAATAVVHGLWVGRIGSSSRGVTPNAAAGARDT
jgi:hypothetical protein